MTKRPQPGSLNEAVTQLVDACGGQKVAASLWGCTSQHVSRFCSDNDKATPRVDQIILAESYCKIPIVTRFMASEQSCIVEQVRSGVRRPLALVLGNIASQHGELFGAAAMDLQNGCLTKANAAIILHESDDVIYAVAELRDGCRATIEGGGT